MQGADNGSMVDFEGTALQLPGPVSNNAASRKPRGHQHHNSISGV
jgi:hypothetical protein